MFATLPVLMALSWVPTPAETAAPAPTHQKTGQPAQATETIRCPLTGEEIPSCCCPVKK
jgi:hypothetical protein